MATKMEQRAKFRELRLAGTSREDAIKQAYGSVAPVTPTANPPVTPPTPTATPPQTMQGVNGETFQVAPTNAQGISTPTQPVQPPTPAPAPVTPPPTATPTPTQPTTATVAPEDKAAEIQAKNQAQMDLNKQKSQLAIEDRKRQAEEAKQASIPTDEKGVLNTLISGGSVAPQNTQAYRNAQFKYKNYQKFNSMTPQQLLDNMKMGEIDTETSQLLASNPNYVKAKEDFDRFQKNQSINNMVRSTYGGATGKKEEVDYYNKSASEVAKRLGVNETNAEAFARIVSGSPLVTQLTQTVSNTAKQLNELNNERNNVYADLKKQYPDLSPSAIMTLMGQRTQGLTDQINALNSTLSLTQADLKNAMEMAQAEYSAVSADIQAQQEIAKEKRAVQAQKDIQAMQFENQKSLKEMDYAQQEKIKKMEKETDSKWSVIGSDANGNSIYGFVNQTTGQVTPYGQNTGTVTGLTTLAGQTDLTSLASKYPGVAAFKNNNPSGITWQAASQGLKDAWTQAGIQFAQGTARPANEGGNYVAFASAEDGIKAKMIAITRGYGNATVNQFLDKWGTGSGNIKVSFDKNRRVNDLSEQEFNELVTKQMAWESPNFLKEYESMKSSKGTQAVSQYNDQNIADLAYLVELQEKNPTQAAKDMKELGYTARDLANYKSGNVPLTEKQKNTSMDIIEAIRDLTDSNRYEWNDAVGKFDPKRLIGTQDAEDATIAINNLVAKLTLPNLGVLKGPMSDKDIQFIKEASTKLATTQSNKSFERNLIDAYNLAARRAGLQEVKTLDDIKKGASSMPTSTNTGAGQISQQDLAELQKLLNP